MVNYKIIGIVGSVNLFILLLIIIWRTYRCYSQWTSPITIKSYSFHKKLAFHLLLLIATLCEIPFYVCFYVYNDYNLIAYSFHKLSSAFFFAGLSITISDWSSVLYDINEFKLFPFLLRKWTLLTINLFYFIISLTNFICCYALKDLDNYTANPIYVVGIFFQISASILLTGIMLHAGLKLYSRISGAAGNLDSSYHGTLSSRTTNGRSTKSTIETVTNPTHNLPNGLPTMSLSQNSNKTRDDSSDIEANQESAVISATSHPSVASNISNVNGSFDGSLEFRNALRNLNLVMATCSICISVQMIMMMLNYALGYSNDTNQYVGPPIFYWAATSWVPLWGPALALLYLSRAHSNKNTKITSKPFQMTSSSSSEPHAFLKSPLIGANDYDNFTESDGEYSQSRSYYMYTSRTGQSSTDHPPGIRQISDDTFNTPDQSRSCSRFYGDLSFDLLEGPTDIRPSTISKRTPEPTSKIQGIPEVSETESEDDNKEETDQDQLSTQSVDNSLNYLYRDTTSTMLPSELNFPNLLSHIVKNPGVYIENQDDFSYRGSDFNQHEI